ncbi:hypothetical protein FB565_001003 [Actinoplanes lutulentus]|uniref:Uncharacterized protein n=1 Tax=Actinoplanes lutulentus TaxID=1287878 RepID=A0A327ZBV3_9ACTN|nr:hypothetical protein [Actinoplanes lutulentus]MBB2941299.1 hypothetical protein [Actinoplanes lutulentus]RAK36791.1 hypothetical protein B0I29_10753 [Actinoplanes lutulentus]
MAEHYVIRVRGFLGPLLRRAFSDLRCRTLPSQSTIRARLSDRDLERLLTDLDRSGLEVVCLNRVPSGSFATDGVPAPGSGPRSGLSRNTSD